MFDRGNRERQRRVVEVVSAYLTAAARFEEIYDAYREDNLTFEDIEPFIDDKGKSVLFQAKETCHALFRHNTSTAIEKEQLFDLTIGTIFHEAMKLRENLYQLQVYGMQGRALESKSGRTKNEEDFLLQLHTILKRAARGFAEGMEETLNLFREATEQLKSLLPGFRSNGLLLRYFHEQPGLAGRIFGEQPGDHPFEVLYPQGRGQTFAAAGRSYLESARYSRAQECFLRSIEAGFGDPALPSLLSFSRGMSLFYAGEQEEALDAFEEITDRQGFSVESRALLPEIGRAARRISSELRARGDLQGAERAATIAERAGAPPV
jgi:tetratricopeptide (TPR) repeat protein